MNSPMHGHAWDVTFYMDHAWDRMGPQYGYYHSAVILDWEPDCEKNGFHSK